MTKKIINRIIFSLLFFFCLSANNKLFAQTQDSITLVVTEVIFHDNSLKESSTQVADFFTNELKELIIPVLTIKQMSTNFRIDAMYQKRIDSNTSNKYIYPNYFCKIEVSGTRITANIMKQKASEVYTYAGIERRNSKTFWKDLKKLANETIRKIIEKEYSVKLSNFSKIAIKNNSIHKIIDPSTKGNGNREWIQADAKLPINYLSLQSKDKEYKVEIRYHKAALQLFRIRDKNGVAVLKEQKLRIEPGIFIRQFEDRLILFPQLTARMEVFKKLSFGLSVNTAEIRYNHAMTTFEGFRPIETVEKKRIANINLLADYEFLISSMNLVIGLQAGGDFINNSWYFKTRFVPPKYHWIQLFIGIQGLSFEKDLFQFDPFLERINPTSANVSTLSGMLGIQFSLPL